MIYKDLLLRSAGRLPGYARRSEDRLVERPVYPRGAEIPWLKFIVGVGALLFSVVFLRIFGNALSK